MRLKNISIHALLAESDLGSYSSIQHTEISIHALLAESDNGGYTSSCAGNAGFLSTLSLRRATTSEVSDRVPLAISIHALLAESDLANGGVRSSCFGNFYPRSPCGERQG